MVDTAFERFAERVTASYEEVAVQPISLYPLLPLAKESKVVPVGGGAGGATVNCNAMGPAAAIAAIAAAIAAIVA